MGCFFTQKALWFGPPPEAFINIFPSLTPCLSLWAGVDHNAMSTHCLVLLACFPSEYYSASGLKVFGLATRCISAVFICCHVRVIESPGVRYRRREPLNSCINFCLHGQQMVFHKGSRLREHCDFKRGIHYEGLSHKNFKLVGKVEKHIIHHINTRVLS